MAWIFTTSLILFLSAIASAQSQLPPDDISNILSSENLDSHLGQNWKGIIYVCNPFCEFISLRENRSWNPPVPTVSTPWKNIKAISQSDPLYPLLITKNPILPFVTRKPNIEEPNKDMIAEQPPKEMSRDFNWGFALSGGFVFSQSNWSGNTVLQEDLSSRGVQYAPTAVLQVMKGQPTHLWKWWVLHQLDLQATFSPDYKAKDENVQIQNQEFSLTYQPWFQFKNFKVGPHLVNNIEGWTVPSNSIQHFSFNRTSWLGGISFLWSHWLFSFDTSLASQISEQQQFRQAPFSLKWYKVKIQKCTTDISLFDITFGVCGGLTILSDQQNAAFADNIIIQGTSELNRRDTDVYFLIRIGEDLFQ
jgi:hypothetical protein